MTTQGHKNIDAKNSTLVLQAMQGLLKLAIRYKITTKKNENKRDGDQNLLWSPHITCVTPSTMCVTRRHFATLERV